MPFRVVEDIAAPTWDDFVCAHGGHLLQSSAWGELKARFGWAVYRLGLERNGDLVAGAQILFRALPLNFCLAYTPRGPVASWDDPTALNGLLDTAQAVARRRGAFLLKIEPDRIADAALDRWFTARGYRPGEAIQPRSTLHVDLTRTLDEILAQMKPKWRYNIRLADRKGVRVRVGGERDLPVFHSLLLATGQRDRFAVHALEYYRSAYELLGSERARLFVAEYAQEPLAAIFVTAWGKEAIYLFGASGNSHRERMPNHALHWAAIRWAKERGCQRYDLWGIADVRGEDGGSTEGAALPAGLYQFKHGFGGTMVQYAGAYDMVLSRTRNEIYRRAIGLRKRVSSSRFQVV